MSASRCGAGNRLAGSTTTIAYRLRQLRAQAGDLLPQVGAGERRQGHQHPGVGGADQLGDVLRLQQRVDRIDDPGCLAAPDHVVGLRQVGQQEGHRLVAFQAQPVQGVRGLGDAGEQARHS